MRIYHSGNSVPKERWGTIDENGLAAGFRVLPSQQDHHGAGLELFHVSSAPHRVLLSIPGNLPFRPRRHTT